MILKTKEQIEKIKLAGQVINVIQQQLKLKIKPGITTLEIDKFIEDEILKNKYKPAFKNYNGFKFASCISINEVVVHGIPSEYIIKDGDIVSVDIGVENDGCFADSAYTYIAGNTNIQNNQFIMHTKKCLEYVIENLKVGDMTSKVGQLTQKYLNEHNLKYGIVEELTGHGVGLDLHEDPYIPNYVTNSVEHEEITNGSVIAIEPMFNLGTKKVYLDEDGWSIKTYDNSISAHFEETIAFINDKTIVLTK